MSITIHVAPNGSDATDGTQDEPLRTINRAAQMRKQGTRWWCTPVSTASG